VVWAENWWVGMTKLMKLTKRIRSTNTKPEFALNLFMTTEPELRWTVPHAQSVKLPHVRKVSTRFKTTHCGPPVTSGCNGHDGNITAYSFKTLTS